jgi:molecular chaperone HtpG
MPSSQKDIYYLIADSASAAENSPHLEALKRRGHEVLLMSDPIDPWVMMGLTEYDGHALKAVDRNDLDLAEAGETTDASRKRKTAAKELEGLLKQMQKTLDACVSEVRLSRRLTDSASCLVSDKHAMNPSMERLLRAMHQEPPPMRRILELNADHPVVARMQTLFEQDPADTRLVDYTDLVYDQALLAEGAPVRNPARFTRLVSDLMARAAG